jgi:purine-cytosine permease-like protein
MINFAGQKSIREIYQKMKNFILSIPKGLPTIIMILLALYFTFANNPLGVNGLKVFPYAEQVGHFILYFLVALVFILDYAKAKLPHHSKINQEMALAAVSAVMALLLEIGLMWRTNGYNYDPKNIYAAALGAALAFLFYHFWLLHPFRHYLYHSLQHHWRYQHRRKKKK